MKTLIFPLILFNFIFLSNIDYSEKNDFRRKILMKFDNQISVQIEIYDSYRVKKRKCKRSIQEPFTYYSLRSKDYFIDCSLSLNSYKSVFEIHKTVLDENYFINTVVDDEKKYIYSICYSDSTKSKIVFVECFKNVENSPVPCTILFQIHDKQRCGKIINYLNMVDAVVKFNCEYVGKFNE